MMFFLVEIVNLRCFMSLLKYTSDNTCDNTCDNTYDNTCDNTRSRVDNKIKIYLKFSNTSNRSLILKTNCICETS